VFNVSITIRDETGTLDLLLDSKDKTKLPQIMKIGDILRMHRLKIIEFNGRFQGNKGNPDFNLN
jgi:ssDNA-binding replication factor A large subunit